MRYRVFLDTNVLISGIFFSGNESAILDIPEIDLITCEDCVEELRYITKKKLKYLGDRPLELALLELENALSDFEIIPRVKYRARLETAEKLIGHKKDVPILAAAIYSMPNYFLTGDRHFFKDEVEEILNVKTSNEFLSIMKNRE